MQTYILIITRNIENAKIKNWGEERSRQREPQCPVAEVGMCWVGWGISQGPCVAVAGY